MTSPYPFTVNSKYTRQDVFAVLGIDDPRGGNWYTGYTSHNGDWFIFCGVGAAGRTGHDYDNQFVDGELRWYGKGPSKLSHSSIQSLVSGEGRVYVFYREDDREAFTFGGLAKAKRVFDATPVEVIWTFNSADEYCPLPEEIEEPQLVIEGARKTISVNVYEREPSARRKCISRWGCKCTVCQFDFKLHYGELGDGFIHVHHLKPIADIGQSYELDPVADLRPVCPNCHAMLHRKRTVLSIEELQQLVDEARSA